MRFFKKKPKGPPKLNASTKTAPKKNVKAAKPKRDPILRKADRYLLLLSLLCCAVITYYLFFFKTESRRYSDPIGKLVSAASIKRRHARSLNWRDMASGRDIYLRDIVYTPKNTSAVFLMANNKQIQIGPDTMVQFEQIDLDQIDVNLFGGEIRGLAGAEVKVQQKQKAFKIRRFEGGKLLEYLEDTEGYLLRQQELSQRFKEKLRDPPRVRRTEPKITESKTIVKMRFYQINLYRPSNSEELATDSWIDALWTPVPMSGVKYVMEIDRSRQFKQPKRFRAETNQIQIRLKDAGIYYWRVHALRDNIALKSEVGRFLIRKGRGLSVLRQMPSTLTGLNYDVATDKKFEEIVKTATTEYEKCPEKGLAPGIYFCRIRSVADDKVQRIYRFQVK